MFRKNNRLILLLIAFVLLVKPVKVTANPLNLTKCPLMDIIIENIYVQTAEFNKILYLPKFDGLYKYDESQYYKLYEGNVNFVSISYDGKFLAFSEHGGIKTYNLNTGEVEDILKRNDITVFYEQPTWLPSGKGLLFTKKTLDIDANHKSFLKELSVNTIDLDTKKQIKLGNGSSASFVKNKNAVVFERNSRIIYKSLNNNSEMILDGGMFPRSSPDGKFIAYTKTERNIRAVKENIKVEENLQNMWIASTSDFSVKRKLTCNFLLKTIDEQKWLKNLKPSDSEQILSYSGRYCYLYPSWSSDSKNIFAVVRIYPYPNSSERIQASLIKIPVE